MSRKKFGRESIRFVANAMTTVKLKVTKTEDNATSANIIGVESACWADRREREKG
jgi:hypothetical protein